MNLNSGKRGLSLFCLLVLLVTLLLPEADCWGVRGRALAKGRMARKGDVRTSQGKRQPARRQRPAQRRPLRRRGKDDYPDADVALNDASAPSEPGADAAVAPGDLCEVLMFDRGEGTYTLQFIKNKC